MKWLTSIILCVAMLAPTSTLASQKTSEVSLKKGATCQNLQSLRKEVPTQHLYYKIVGGMKCWHARALSQKKHYVNTSATPLGVYLRPTETQLHKWWEDFWSINNELYGRPRQGTDTLEADHWR